MITILGVTDDRPSRFPVASPDHAAVTEDGNSTVTGNVLNNDFHPDGFPIEVYKINGEKKIGRVADGSYGSIVINADGSYRYTLDNGNPAVDALDDGDVLVETFRYVITDSFNQRKTDLVISIEGAADVPPNVAPRANRDTGRIDENSLASLAGNVLLNDSDPEDDAITVTQVNGRASVGRSVAGSYGSIVLNSGGGYSYTLDNTNPAVDALSEGQSLIERFNYTIFDSELSDSANLVITILGVTDDRPSHFPVAKPDHAVVTEDRNSAVSGNVLDNDSHPDGFPIEVYKVNAEKRIGDVIDGSFGSIVINADGSYRYTLDNGNPTVEALNDGDVLIETFRYVITDSFKNRKTDLVISIEGTTDIPPNVAPRANRDTGRIDENSPASLSGNVLLNDSDPESDAITVTRVNRRASVGRSVAGLYGSIVFNSGGGYRYTLDNTNPAVDVLSDGESLTETFNYTISDSKLSDSANLVITILGVTDEQPSSAPIARPDSAAVTEDRNSTVTGNVLGNDSHPDGFPIEVYKINGEKKIGLVADGSFGSIVINADGSYRYTLDNANPAVDALNDDDVLIETFRYVITDSFSQRKTDLVISIEGATDVPPNPLDPGVVDRVFDGGTSPYSFRTFRRLSGM